jgi:hypothetical protein
MSDQEAGRRCAQPAGGAYAPEPVPVSALPSAHQAQVGVSGSFTASHFPPEGGDLHSHTWHVTAWFDAPTRADGRCYLAALDALLDGWNGSILPADLAWCEDIARAVGALVNCVAVEVRRPDDRIHGRWPSPWPL